MVLMDDSVSSHAKVTLRELRDWREGVKMPTFREGFDRWWLATLVRHRLPVTLYAVQNPAPAWEMPLTSVEWDEPAYNYLSQFRRRTDARKTGR